MVSKIDKTYKPINNLARKVVFGHCEHFTPNKQITNVYKNKPECITKEHYEKLNPQAWLKIEEFIGKKFGRLTVIGGAKYNGSGKDVLPSKAVEKFSKKYGTSMASIFDDAIKKLDFNRIEKSKSKPTKNTKANGRLYVCRCSCGLYLKVRRQTLKNNKKLQCDYCDYTEFLRNGYKWNTEKKRQNYAD